MTTRAALVLEIKFYLSAVLVLSLHLLKMESLSLENLVVVLISTDLFIIFYFLNTCKKQSIQYIFPFIVRRASIFFNRDPNCLRRENDILGLTRP